MKRPRRRMPWKRILEAEKIKLPLSKLALKRLGYTLFTVCILFSLSAAGLYFTELETEIQLAPLLPVEYLEERPQPLLQTATGEPLDLHQLRLIIRKTSPGFSLQLSFAANIRLAQARFDLAALFKTGSSALFGQFSDLQINLAAAPVVNPRRSTPLWLIRILTPRTDLELRNIRISHPAAAAPITISTLNATIEDSSLHLNHLSLDLDGTSTDFTGRINLSAGRHPARLSIEFATDHLALEQLSSWWKAHGSNLTFSGSARLMARIEYTLQADQPFIISHPAAVQTTIAFREITVINKAGHRLELIPLSLDLSCSDGCQTIDLASTIFDRDAGHSIAPHGDIAILNATYNRHNRQISGHITSQNGGIEFTDLAGIWPIKLFPDLKNWLISNVISGQLDRSFFRFDLATGQGKVDLEISAAELHIADNFPQLGSTKLFLSADNRTVKIKADKVIARPNRTAATASLDPAVSSTSSATSPAVSPLYIGPPLPPSSPTNQAEIAGVEVLIAPHPSSPSLTMLHAKGEVTAPAASLARLLHLPFGTNPAAAATAASSSSTTAAVKALEITRGTIHGPFTLDLPLSEKHSISGLRINATAQLTGLSLSSTAQHLLAPHLRLNWDKAQMAIINNQVAFVGDLLLNEQFKFNNFSLKLDDLREKNYEIGFAANINRRLVNRLFPDLDEVKHLFDDKNNKLLFKYASSPSKEDMHIDLLIEKSEKKLLQLLGGNLHLTAKLARHENSLVWEINDFAIISPKVDLHGQGRIDLDRNIYEFRPQRRQNLDNRDPSGETLLSNLALSSKPGEIPSEEKLFFRIIKETPLLRIETHIPYLDLSSLNLRELLSDHDHSDNLLELFDRDLDLTFSASLVNGHYGKNLNNLQVKLRKQSDHPTYFSLDADLHQEKSAHTQNSIGYVALFYNRPVFTIVSNNIGHFIQFAGINRDLQAGQIELKLRLDEADTTASHNYTYTAAAALASTPSAAQQSHDYRGFIELNKANWVNAPALSGLLKLISISSIFNSFEQIISGPGLGIDSSSCLLSYQQKRLIILRDCIVTGPSIYADIDAWYDLHTDATRVEGVITPHHFFHTAIVALGMVWPQLKYKMLQRDKSIKNFIFERAVDGKTNLTFRPLSMIIPGFFGSIFNIRQSTSEIIIPMATLSTNRTRDK